MAKEVFVRSVCPSRLCQPSSVNLPWRHGTPRRTVPTSPQAMNCTLSFPKTFGIEGHDDGIVVSRRVSTWGWCREE